MKQTKVNNFKRELLIRIVPCMVWYLFYFLIIWVLAMKYGEPNIATSEHGEVIYMLGESVVERNQYLFNKWSKFIFPLIFVTLQFAASFIEEPKPKMK